MAHLRRKDVLQGHPVEFSPVLFDVLFGLLIFLGVGAFASLKDGTHLAFYLASLVVVLHWWLKYKAADAAYGHDVSNSTTDLLFGLTEIVLLQMAMLAAAQADYVTAIVFFALPLIVESVWALLWRFFGTWPRSSRQRVRYLEQELDYTIFLNLGAATLLGGLIAFAPALMPADLVLCFIWAYALYVILTQRLEIIDVKLF